MTTKLNIGAGDTVIEGFTAIDRKHGVEAYPLSYDDNSVDEIRASHILEHFGMHERHNVLADWVRVLKPGGRIRVAVPDFDLIKDGLADDPKAHYYLMGGQQDENDYHRSVYTEPVLRKLMEDCGLSDVQRWTSKNTDCAALPVSLNLEGVKTGEPARKVSERVKIAAIMSIPRYGSLAARGDIDRALFPFRIHLDTYQGVFWGQCMQRQMNKYIDLGVDWILAIDYDSMFCAEQLDTLMSTLANNPRIDALAALQVRRTGDKPLMTVFGENEVEITGDPVKVTTAHFGMTLIRVDALKKTPKPWFKAEPDDDGEWGDKRLDDDIWFWHQWRLAGNNIYVAPEVRIGHLEECVSAYTEDMQAVRYTVNEWRERMKDQKNG